MQLKDSVFIVTGAGSGLGAATARMLSGGGARVLLADINETAGGAVAADLGAGARFVRTDVASEESAGAAVAAALASFGALHGLVNCAGIAPAERVVGRQGPHRLDTFRRVIEVNLVGSFNMIRLAAEAMSHQVPFAPASAASSSARLRSRRSRGRSPRQPIRPRRPALPE